MYILRTVFETDELSVFIVMSRREGHDPGAYPDQVFGLGSKNDCALTVISVIQGTDPDRVSCRDEFMTPGVIDHHRKLGIQK